MKGLSVFSKKVNHDIVVDLSGTTAMFSGWSDSSVAWLNDTGVYDGGWLNKGWSDYNTWVNTWIDSSWSDGK